MDSPAVPEGDAALVWQAIKDLTPDETALGKAPKIEVLYSKLLRLVLRRHVDFDEERVRAALEELQAHGYVDVDMDFGPASRILRRL